MGLLDHQFSYKNEPSFTEKTNSEIPELNHANVNLPYPDLQKLLNKISILQDQIASLQQETQTNKVTSLKQLDSTITIDQLWDYLQSHNDLKKDLLKKVNVAQAFPVRLHLSGANIGTKYVNEEIVRRYGLSDGDLANTNFEDSKITVNVIKHNGHTLDDAGIKFYTGEIVDRNGHWKLIIQPVMVISAELPLLKWGLCHMCRHTKKLTSMILKSAKLSMLAGMPATPVP